MTLAFATIFKAKVLFLMDIFETREFILCQIAYTFKVVICGKYINLNKITKIKHISLKFNRLLIFVILYSLQCKIEGHAVYKSVLIRKDQRQFLCAKI